MAKKLIEKESDLLAAQGRNTLAEISDELRLRPVCEEVLRYTSPKQVLDVGSVTNFAQRGNATSSDGTLGNESSMEVIACTLPPNTCTPESATQPRKKDIGRPVLGTGSLFPQTFSSFPLVDASAACKGIRGVSPVTTYGFASMSPSGAKAEDKAYADMRGLFLREAEPKPSSPELRRSPEGAGGLRQD